MEPNSKEIKALIAASGEKRYAYFVKRVTDSEQVWGLYDDGWALASTDDGASVFPLWPAEAYANLCIQGMWRAFKPQMIPLDDLLDELLPNLKADGVALGIFCTPEKAAVMIETEKLIEDIQSEFAKYE